VKKKTTRKDVSQQYARYLEAARKAKADQGGGTFAAGFKKVAATKKVPKGSGL
jgi:hypothetical protein